MNSHSHANFAVTMIFKSEFIKPKSQFFAWLKCPGLDRVKKIIIVIFTKVGKALGNLSFPGLPNSYFYLVLIMPIIGNKDANQYVFRNF